VYYSLETFVYCICIVKQNAFWPGQWHGDIAVRMWSAACSRLPGAAEDSVPLSLYQVGLHDRGQRLFALIPIASLCERRYARRTKCLYSWQHCKISAIVHVAAQCCTSRTFAFEWGRPTTNALFLSNVWEYHYKSLYRDPILWATFLSQTVWV